MNNRNIYNLSKIKIFMITLVKGNINNLEGKVIVYAKHANIEIPNMAVCASDDKEHLSETGQIHLELAETLLRLAKENAENVGENVGENMDMKMAYGGYAAVQIDNFREDQIKDRIEDVLYCGKWTRPAFVMGSIENGLSLYFMKYFEQEKINKKLSREVEKQSLIEDKVLKIDSEGNNRNIQTYLGSLMDANRNGEEREFNALRNNFMRYYDNSSIAKYAGELCDLLKVGKGKNADNGIVHLHIQKISAIVSENYESARQIDNQIKAYKINCF